MGSRGGQRWPPGSPSTRAGRRGGWTRCTRSQARVKGSARNTRALLVLRGPCREAAGQQARGGFHLGPRHWLPRRVCTPRGSRREWRAVAGPRRARWSLRTRRSRGVTTKPRSNSISSRRAARIPVRRATLSGRGEPAATRLRTSSAGSSIASAESMGARAPLVGDRRGCARGPPGRCTLRLRAGGRADAALRRSAQSVGRLHRAAPLRSARARRPCAAGLESPRAPSLG